VKQVNIHEAKTQFSKLIEAVERGEEVVIARRGKPVAKLTACDEAPRREVRFGTLAGLVTVYPSFYEDMSEDELEDWYGSEDNLLSNQHGDA
jgi:prevent-host-death family protein